MDEFERIQKMLEAKENVINGKPAIANLSLTTQERLDIYNEILELLNSGEDNRHIAQHVVGILNNHINLKMMKEKERQRGKSPIFRRVDDG